MKERIVCVEWDDACFDSGYYDKNKPEEFEPTKIRSVGHLVKSSRKSIIISTDRSYDSKGGLKKERQINTIPRGIIRKITELKG